MLLKITEKCSINCTHCMNRATADGEHMTEQIFDDALDFLLDNNACDVVTITGGEPTEHPEFSKLMWKLISKMEYEERPCIVNITTNGFWCLEHPEEAKKIAVETKYVKVFWQVSTDRRYYPKELPTHKKLWREPGFCLCEDCVESLYPQGRAIDNYPDSCSAKASKCFNVRAMAKQITDPSIERIVRTLMERQKFCAPAIRIDGSISLGESDLCPKMASIYDNPDEIVRNIISFKCHQCDHINDKLPDLYKRFL